ncbi:hypothetical protein AVEN_227191-1, partial [Araneus ventricosus]
GFQESEVWIVGSGKSSHMTKHKKNFVDFTKFISPKPIYMGNSDTVMAYGHLTVNGEIKNDGKWDRNHLAEL